MYQIIKLVNCEWPESETRDFKWVPVNKATFDDQEDARVAQNALKRMLDDPTKIHEIGTELPDA